MKNKKVISAVLSVIFVTIGMNFSFSNAAVIEPEIVKTETWITSYYIDDDDSVTYPYIECQADIYNDGTVKFYFWNTHEWDGFATVSHAVTIINSCPYPKGSKEYMFKNKHSYTYNEYYEYYPVSDKESKITDYSTWDSIDLSYYPNEYESISRSLKTPYFNSTWYNTYNNKPTYYYYYAKPNSSTAGELTYSDRLWQFTYYGALPNLPVNEKIEVVFIPKIDIIEEYSFRFLGHDLIVSPDILSSHIVATPQLTEQEKYIAELEQKNRELTEELERLKAEPSSILDDVYKLDANSDGMVDASDASIILSIYAYNSTNKVPITSLSEYFSMEQ